MDYSIVKTMKVSTITGDSQIVKGAIDVFAFDYAAHKPVHIQSTGLAGSGAPDISPVSVSFTVCSATPPMKQNFLKGTTFASVVLTEYKTNQTDQPKAFRIVTLTNAQINAFQNTETTGSLSLVFEKIEEEFFKQSTENGQLTSSGKVTFNMLTRTVS
ncbi:hypothetical protein WI61_08145 [Burkholderia cepacia]|uniref:type VI secretion system tube protein Hcp n=1 Tax=Burkholderia cepacia TaxID=292 RepID=UPI000751E6EE|nr:type VI secretion system tube protein Hcp [Burkholderia cepacia]KVA46781.1 hypothetical protein WI47_21240 [Burkholderia cepacia]KVA51580.1 hypothetical protein WI48_25985 [Burkholderia cepacia]KVA70844.1 hypothetical protein WI49_35460 [Burkholderia cepacia]KVA78904.1 hypothetical protein WI51_27700 [Burkholderia cepacia]KVA78926.1 hypothetical protein WI52_25590 [Burkholderia cepacia]